MYPVQISLAICLAIPPPQIAASSIFFRGFYCISLDAPNDPFFHLSVLVHSLFLPFLYLSGFQIFPPLLDVTLILFKPYPSSLSWLQKIMKTLNEIKDIIGRKDLQQIKRIRQRIQARRAMTDT